MATEIETTTTEAATGILGPLCLHCGQEGIKMFLDADCDTFQCKECNDCYTLDEVEQVIEGWQRVIRLAESARAIMRGE